MLKIILRAHTSPLPSRAPVIGSTATDPMTIKSTFSLASVPIGFPYLAAPAVVQASAKALLVREEESNSEKNPVRNLGCGTNNFLFPVGTS